MRTVGVGQDSVNHGTVGNSVGAYGVVVVHNAVVSEPEVPVVPIGILNVVGYDQSALWNRVFGFHSGTCVPVVGGTVVGESQGQRSEGNLMAFV